MKRLMGDCQYGIHAGCEKVGICHSLFFRWQKPLPIASQVINKRKKNIHPGRSCILMAKQDNILKFVSELRDAGMPVNSKMVQLEVL